MKTSPYVRSSQAYRHRGEPSFHAAIRPNIDADLIVVYDPYGNRSYRSYDVLTHEGFAVAKYCRTIKQARAIAGALSGLAKSFSADDPRLKSREAAEKEWGAELIAWWFQVEKGNWH